jgi:hypothetical protein
MLCFAGPIGLYLHQPGDPQLNEDARSRWRLLQCTMDSKYPEAARGELIDYMTLRAAAVANLRSNDLPQELRLQSGFRVRSRSSRGTDEILPSAPAAARRGGAV